MVTGIFEYIFGPKHVMELLHSSVLDLSKEGLYLGMERSAYGCVDDGLKQY